jgi:hypothetical protein
MVGKKTGDQNNKDPHVFYLSIFLYIRKPDHHLFYHGFYPGTQILFQTIILPQAQKRLGY